jgi:hypothetical protein
LRTVVIVIVAVQLAKFQREIALTDTVPQFATGINSRPKVLMG